MTQGRRMRRAMSDGERHGVAGVLSGKSAFSAAASSSRGRRGVRSEAVECADRTLGGFDGIKAVFGGEEVVGSWTELWSFRVQRCWSRPAGWKQREVEGRDEA